MKKADLQKQHFDTGMSYEEAEARAGRWWDEWRGAIRRGFNMISAEPRVKSSLATMKRAADKPMAPGLILPGETMEDLPSGILSGKAWRELGGDERVRILVMWHHFHVRVPLQGEEAAPATELDKMLLEIGSLTPMAGETKH